MTSLPSPILPRRWPARRIEPAHLLTVAREGPRRELVTSSSARASAACSSPLAAPGPSGTPPPYLVRDLAADLGYPLAVVAPPALGTINHTLLTIESARAAGLEVAAVVLTPGQSPPPKSSAPTARRSVGAVDVKVLPQLDLFTLNLARTQG